MLKNSPVTEAGALPETTLENERLRRWRGRARDRRTRSALREVRRPGPRTRARRFRLRRPRRRFRRPQGRSSRRCRPPAPRCPRTSRGERPPQPRIRRASRRRPPSRREERERPFCTQSASFPTPARRRSRPSVVAQARRELKRRVRTQAGAERGEFEGCWWSGSSTTSPMTASAASKRSVASGCVERRAASAGPEERTLHQRIGDAEPRGGVDGLWHQRLMISRPIWNSEGQGFASRSCETNLGVCPREGLERMLPQPRARPRSAVGVRPEKRRRSRGTGAIGLRVAMTKRRGPPTAGVRARGSAWSTRSNRTRFAWRRARTPRALREVTRCFSALSRARDRVRRSSSKPPEASSLSRAQVTAVGLRLGHAASREQLVQERKRSREQ